ncbi:MAG: hypothetical protein CME06_10270 [Gemmatimonadetes bacterium]|nr:hypothetical protein [Gemmatimonadota bacterium]
MRSLIPVLAGAALAFLPATHAGADTPEAESGPEWSGFIQFRYDGIEGDDDAATSTVSSMRIRRARVKATGELRERFAYKLQLSMARGASSVAVDPTLLDATLTWSFGADLALTCGQFKIPVGHEEVQPAWRIDLIDYFHSGARLLNPVGGRDIGAKISGKGVGGRFRWGLGLFNGSGPNIAANDDAAFLYAAALDWSSPAGDQGTFYLHASGLIDQPAGGEDSDPSPLTRSDLDDPFAAGYERRVLDLAAGGRYGPWSLKGEYIAAELTADAPSGPRIAAGGYFVQAGRGFFEEKIELFARHQTYDPDDRSAGADAIDWTTLSLNHYMEEHSAKLMANYVLRREDGASIDNDTFQLQFQLKF